MCEKFGAVVTDMKVEFKLFFPDNKLDPSQFVNGSLPKIEEIRIRGDFQSKTGANDWGIDSASVMAKDKYPKDNPIGWWIYQCNKLPPQNPANKLKLGKNLL